MSLLFNHLWLVITISGCSAFILARYNVCPKRSPALGEKCQDMCSDYCMGLVYTVGRDLKVPTQGLFECTNGKTHEPDYTNTTNGWVVPLPAVVSKDVVLGQQCPELTEKETLEDSEEECQNKCEEYVIYTLDGEVKICASHEDAMAAAPTIWHCDQDTNECSCPPEITLK